MAIAHVLFVLAALIAFTATVFFATALFWVTRRRRRLPDFTPPITIYKPVKGIDEGLEENLRSFFQLDYPTYQILFGVAEVNDPAIEVISRLLREFPNQDAKLVAGVPPFGLNPKVESLAALDRHREHDTILISDSNVRARPSYLRETACYLAEPGVGLVTNLFAGVGETRAGAILENLQLNGFIAGGFAAAYVCGATCVVGKSMMMPVRVLEAIGGWEGVRDILAEDQIIGIRVRRAGYKIRLSHHVIANVNQVRGFRWFFNRHSRWYKIRRQVATPAFLAEPLSNLTVVGLVWALSSESAVGWLGMLGLVSLGLLRDAVQTYRLRGSFPKFRHLLLSPAKDLLVFPLWIDGLVSRRVMWRGHRMIIGRLTRLQPMSDASTAGERTRWVRRLRERGRH